MLCEGEDINIGRALEAEGMWLDGGQKGCGLLLVPQPCQPKLPLHPFFVSHGSWLPHVPHVPHASSPWGRVKLGGSHRVTSA